MLESTAFQSLMEDGINEFLKEIVLDSGTRMSLLFLSAYAWSALFRGNHIYRADFVWQFIHLTDFVVFSAF